MGKEQIELLKREVTCEAVLQSRGFSVDRKESTTKAIKYRDAHGHIAIVIHEGHGFFDPLSEAKGDIFSLMMHLDSVAFPQAVSRMEQLVGAAFQPAEFVKKPKSRMTSQSIETRWYRKNGLYPESAGWRYLTQDRCIPAGILQSPYLRKKLRQTGRGTVCALHRTIGGTMTGWEYRGSDYRGFSSGGGKSLFYFGDRRSTRICITEAFIDAISLAAIEHRLSSSLYASTAGGWSPNTVAEIGLWSTRVEELVAAFDNDDAGDRSAERLEEIAQASGCRFLRLTPQTQDWNEDHVRLEVMRKYTV